MSTPMVNCVDRPDNLHCASIAAGVGGSRLSTSSNRAASGIPASSSSRLTSRSGARLRARSSAHSGVTESAVTLVTWPFPELLTVRWPPMVPSNAATAWHSSGSIRSLSSMQTDITPTAGPSRRIWMTPGAERSVRAPSSTTTTSPNTTPRRRGSSLDFSRAVIRASTSAARVVTVSSSLPMSTEQS